MIKTKVHVTANFRPELMNYKHNKRIKKYCKREKNVDLSHYHETIIDCGDIDIFFNEMFRDAVKDYNAKQKRSDRKIKNEDYLLYIKKKKLKSKHNGRDSDGRIKPVYEIEFKVGSRDCQWPNRKQLYKILRLWVKLFEELYGRNVKIVGAFLHDDEYSISKDKKKNKIFNPPHLHLDIVFVGHALTEEEIKIEDEDRERIRLEKMEEYKRNHKKWDEALWKKTDWTEYRVKKFGKALRNGLSESCSMSAALAELGFRTAPKKQTAQIQFEHEVHKQFQDFCESMGINVDRTKVESHSHVSPEVLAEINENKKKEQLLKKQELQNKHDRKIIEKKELEVKMKTDELENDKKEIKELKEAYAEKQKNLNSLEKELTKRESIIKTTETKLDARKNSIVKKENEYKDSISVLTKLEEKINSVQEEFSFTSETAEPHKPIHFEKFDFLTAVTNVSVQVEKLVNRLKNELAKYKRVFQGMLNYTPKMFRNLADSMEHNNCSNYYEFNYKFERGELDFQKPSRKKESNTKHEDLSRSI